MTESRFASLDYEIPVPPQESPIHAMSLGPGDPQSLLAQMIRLNLLLYEIVRMNVRVVAEHSEGLSGPRLHYNLIQSLDDWVKNLPPLLQYSEENVARWVEVGLGSKFIIMHMNYNHTGQLLFYQYLHSAQDVKLNAPETIRRMAQKCKQHATNLCDLIYRAEQRPETIVFYPLAAHILSLASTVQIHTLLFDVDEVDISAAKMRLERNFEIISSMNRYWPMTHKTITRLQHFHNACLRSQDDSFQLDTWMLQFLLGFTKDVEDRTTVWRHETWSTELEHLRQLLDI